MSTWILRHTEECLERIGRDDSAFRAFITVTADSARQRAAELDARFESGDAAGQLAGLVIAIKDNIDTAGLLTTCGSAFDASRVPNEDAEVVQRLRRAGAVSIGKTNLHEFAFGATTQNPHFGDCRNPWDPEAIPGGSSGGSAVAVATGMCDAALGTDTGGSIRVPAALTGVVGLRPTVGRVSNRGVAPVAPQLDTVGPLARTVTDVARVYESIAGYDPDDGQSVDRPVESWCNALPRGISGLRIGLPTTYFFDEIDAEVADLVRAAAQVMGTLGGELRAVPIAGIAELHAGLASFVPTNLAAYNRERLASTPEVFGPDVRKRISLGLKTTGMDYADWLRLIERWGLQVRRLFETVDVVLTPTVATPAPKVSASSDLIAATGALTRFTFVWSYAQLPALSVPCGFTRVGLPVGMQLIGPKWSEPRLLAVGSAYQEATDFHRRRPDARA
jgi:aspartyl-tRNA(Asn)/glutamyl-tRNA(Gln) amidotransferase subunit A